MVPVWMTFSDL